MPTPSQPSREAIIADAEKLLVKWQAEDSDLDRRVQCAVWDTPSDSVGNFWNRAQLPAQKRRSAELANLLAALVSAPQPDEKRWIDDGNGMTNGYTFDEALAEIARLGKRCEELYQASAPTCGTCTHFLPWQRPGAKKPLISGNGDCRHPSLAGRLSGIDVLFGCRLHNALVSAPSASESIELENVQPRPWVVGSGRDGDGNWCVRDANGFMVCHGLTCNEAHLIAEAVNGYQAAPSASEPKRCTCPAPTFANEEHEPKCPLSSPARQGWQPIDSAPKDGTLILLCLTPRHDYVAMDVGCWFRTERLSDVGGWWVSHAVKVCPTHWMPLPPPSSSQEPTP